MGAVESLLRRLGYVRLSRFDLMLTTDGQLLSRTTGKRVDGGDLDFGGPLPSALSMPVFNAPAAAPPMPITPPAPAEQTRSAPPPIPQARRRPASPRAPSPVIAVLPLSPPPSTGPFEREPDPESVVWQRKLVEARSRAQRDEEREWELAMARARAAAESTPPAPDPDPEPSRILSEDLPLSLPKGQTESKEPDEEREWELAMARARAAAESAPASSPARPLPSLTRSPAPSPGPSRLARGSTSPPIAPRPTRTPANRAPVRGPGAPPSARTTTPGGERVEGPLILSEASRVARTESKGAPSHVGRAPRTRSTPRIPRATGRPPLRTGA